MLRAVLLLLVTFILACQALPSHHRHHSELDRDFEVLEKGLDDIVEAEEDDEEDEEEDEEDEEEASILTDPAAVKLATGPTDLLVALDCGSSGTKIMIYASASTGCPATPTPLPDGKEICDDMKWSPTMNKLNAPMWAKALGSGTPSNSRVHRAIFEPFKDNVKFVMAFATAGNRIIPASENSSAWTSMISAIEAYRIDWIGAPQTIPGTNEAFLEFLASGRVEFISMGGASAQAAILIDSTQRAKDWVALLGNLASMPACNNQRTTADFATTVLKTANDYSEIIAASAVESTCKDKECVGLYSWLSGPAAGVTGGECPTSKDSKDYHLVGGNDEAQRLLKLDVSANAHCHTTPDAKKCAEAMTAFANKDEMTKEFAAYVGKHGAFEPVVMAALAGAVTKYQGFALAMSFQLLLDNHDGGATFAIWGVHGFLVPLGVAGTKITVSSVDTGFYTVTRTPNYANWITARAYEFGFKHKCQFAITAEVYAPTSDQERAFVSKVQEKPCQADLRVPVAV